MLPGEFLLDEHGRLLVRFLEEEGERIARFAARRVTSDLPVAGTGARRRLREDYQEQIAELGRLLELYGMEDAPRVYGESQRRYAAARLSQGFSLRDTIEERAILEESLIEVWGLTHDTFSPEIARVLASAFAETTAQTGDVYLTYQRAESSAFQEAALLETIVSHLDEAILVVERDGLISYATPAFEHLLGYPAQLFVGISLERLSGLMERLNFRDRFGEPIPPDALPHNLALHTQKPQHEEAMLVRRADGTDAVIEAHAAPVFDEDGELRGAVETLRDRTESFRQTLALESSLRERRQMHARLLARTKLEAVGSIAGSAAHALNNQLNVITLRLRKLQEIPGAATEAEAISRSVHEITVLVGRLQELAAAPSQGKAAPIDASKVVAEAIALVRPEFDGRQVDVNATVGDLGMVLGDRETLLALLTALLAGARDATPVGGSVDLEADRKDDQVRIRIVDHGPPLGQDELEQLFEPLAGRAGDRSLSLSGGREALHRWGGEVEVESLEGVGNVFTIDLAAVEPGAAAVAPEAVAPRALAGAAHRVLVVDDDPDNAAMLADLVEGAHAEAMTAGTGAEALDKAARKHPDAALVDLLLPDMKGWEVVRRLREQDPDLRIAVVSGLAVGREERESGRADEVFRKPIDSDEVLHFLGL